MNLPLLSMIYSMTATVLIGVMMIAALVIGFDEIPDIITVSVVGAIVSIPIAIHFTNRVGRIGSDESDGDLR